MCLQTSIPPTIELDEYSTDANVIKCLMQLISGHTLPPNILSDVDPRQHAPSNLPPDMWYFCSGSTTDAKNMTWRSTGEACEIYSTATTIGLRKTLQFYDGEKNWIMQEYTTTEKHTSKTDPRALYRVFEVDDSSSRSTEHLSKSEPVRNTDDVAGSSDVANESSIQLLGDYLELDDLDIPLTPTTSSAGSSCMTVSMTSEEFFDSDALLRELDEDIVDQEIQDSQITLSLCAPAKLKQVVMQPTSLSVSTSPPLPPPPPPSSEAAASSSNSSQGSSKEEKKDRTKKRKMMKYLCFLAI